MIRRKYRRALNTVALALTASVMLNMTGCGGIGTSAGTSTEATDTAKGRYIESEINMPADCSSPNVVTFDDGSTAFVDTNNGVLYTKTSIDQKDWQGRDIPKLIELIGQSMDIEVAVPSKDGKLFISYNNWDEVEDVDSAVGYPVHYLLIDSDDSVRELTLTDIEKLEHAVFSDEDTLYLGDYDGRVMRHSISSGTSEKILNTDNGYIETLNIFNNKLFVMDFEKAYSYDLTSGTLDEDDSVLDDFISKMGYDDVQQYCGDSKDSDSIYVISRDGIYHHKMGGSVMEKLVDGMMTSLSDQSLSPSSVSEKDGVIYLFFNDGSAFSYKYDETASAEMENQIEIYALEDSKTVRQAISAFRKSNPDVFVKFEIGMDSDSGIQKSDAITALNTKLLSGEGPDLLILDGLPMEKYEKKGILEDLSSTVDELTDSANYFEGILKAYENDGKIYALPTRAEIPVVIGDSELTKKVKDTKSLADVSQQILSDKEVYATTLGTYSPEEALKLAYFGSSNSWQTADGSIDEEKIKEILETAKVIYEDDAENLTESQKNNRENINKEIASSGEIDADTYWGSGARQADDVAGKYQYAGIGSLGNMSDISELFSVPQSYDGISYGKYDGDDDNLFIPQNVVGICSASDKKELAEAFVKELLSQNVQKTDTEDGCPVNKDAYDEFVVNPDPGSMIGGSFPGADGSDCELIISWPAEAELAELKDWLDTASTPQNIDSDVKMIFIDNGTAAVSGEKDVDSCVKEIVQKLTLYLAE